MVLLRRIYISSALFCCSCVGPGLLTDGTSISIGHHGRGLLRNSSVLPVKGEGYVIPKKWRERKRNYGTDELVQLIIRSSRRVAKAYRKSILGVADLSAKSGGLLLPEHASHQNGRDVDLIYYATDLKGNPIIPEEMITYDAQGLSITLQPKETSKTPTNDNSQISKPSDSTTSQQVEDTPLRKLDIPRNWAFLKAMATDPFVSVQWIFVGQPIANLLLNYAKKKKEPKDIVNRVAILLHQPGDAPAHMDHMHIRIFCPVSDRSLGCKDRGPSRSLNEFTKYVNEPQIQIKLLSNFTTIKLIARFFPR